MLQECQAIGSEIEQYGLNLSLREHEPHFFLSTALFLLCESTEVSSLQSCTLTNVTFLITDFAIQYELKKKRQKKKKQFISKWEPVKNFKQDMDMLGISGLENSSVLCEKMGKGEDP